MQSNEQNEYARDLINSVEFTKHALARMAERNIPISAVLGAIDQGRYLPRLCGSGLCSFKRAARGYGFKRCYYNFLQGGLMNQLEKKTLELALLLCLPESFKKRGLHKGRQANLVLRIKKELDNKIIKMPKIDDDRVKPMADIVVQFAKRLGWDKGKHVHTLLAFSLELMERSEYQYPQRLWDAMTGLVAHIENRTPTYPACCVAGAAAVDKWEKIMEEASWNN